MKPTMSALGLAFILLLGFSGAAAGAQLEQQLANRLNGAWSILLTEGYSDCSGYYNNNEVNLSGVTSKAARRFSPGELVKIDKINLKRSRLDLFLSLAEPVLIGYTDGPFELFAERECKIQLLIDIPREIVKTDDVEAVVRRIAPIVEIHRSADQATTSIAYNGREREEYPADYELTLARHASWQAEQINAAVTSRLAAASQGALSLAVAIRRDGDYLDGFAAGVEELRSWREDDCSRLIDISFDSVRNRSKGSGDRSSLWKDGYADGQELIFNLFLAERLPGCFVPVPPLP